MTISRSRKHITNYYGNKDVGKFPDKNKPITMNSDIDSRGELLNFRDTNDLLEALILSVYTPTSYIKEEYKKYYMEKYSLTGKHGGKISFDTQSRGMIILHRFNLFKRLESSVYSFEETLRRLLERIERTEDLLRKGSGLVDEEETDFDGEEEDVRMAIVKKVVENGEKEITILSLAEALKLLGLAEKDLNKVDYINCKLYTERKTRKYQKGQTYIDKNEKPTTIGDVLRLQGVDISKFLSED